MHGADCGDVAGGEDRVELDTAGKQPLGGGAAVSLVRGSIDLQALVGRNPSSA
jgi:hypothetical protein